MVNLSSPLLIGRLAPHISGQRERLSRVLGAKAMALTESLTSGLPVPDFFILPADFIARLMESEQHAYDELFSTMQSWQDRHGSAPLGKKLGLMALRASPAAEQIKPFDALLHFGMTEQTLTEFALHADERVASDAYRRFLSTYGVAVQGFSATSFEDCLLNYREEVGDKEESAFNHKDWQEIITAFKHLYQQRKVDSPPDSWDEQLRSLIRSMVQRHQEPVTMIIQWMAFGTLKPQSAAGLAETSSIDSGEPSVTGHILPQAMVGDFPTSYDSMVPLYDREGKATDYLEEKTHKALNDLGRNLESLEGWILKFSFIIEASQIWLLAFSRCESLRAEAQFVLLARLVEQGSMTKEEAILTADPTQLEAMLHPSVDPGVQVDLLAKGLPASPGAAKGHLVFSVEEIEALKLHGEASILVKAETTPDDVAGLVMANGILTLRGGMTSHAAVIARGLGKPCVTGASGMRIDPDKGCLTVGNQTLERGSLITIDGTNGRVLAGDVPLRQVKPSPAVSTLLGWANEVRRLKVRVNAESVADLELAKSFGAEGIGLCRTEHMLLTPSRLAVIRRMILAETRNERKEALAKLLPEQKKDLRALFRLMSGYPVTIRLLDPPLHEFLPGSEREIKAMAASLQQPFADVARRVEELHEVNPMLGHRGCRLTITFPEILEMQARALLEAAAEEEAEGTQVRLEVMVPLIALRRELVHIAEIFSEVSHIVKTEKGHLPHYTLGTMIETPRAALRAEEIAEISHFFSFGTNDLTQTTFGISRDDATTFLRAYLQGGLIDDDPFQTLDKTGVGELMAMAVRRGREVRPDIEIGICGEHGGDPQSVAFCEELALDYVSCSPFRVPIAQLSAAQAFLLKKRQLKT